MKKLLIIAFIGICSITAKGQDPCDNMLFPTIDSLRNYINIYIRNSAVTAFTNLRLNTALVGTTQWLECLESSGGGGGGTDNANAGSGYRILISLTQELKTLAAGYGIIIDTSLSNRLRFTVDTANLPKDTLIEGQGIKISKVWGQITVAAHLDYVSVKDIGGDATGATDVSSYIATAAATGKPIYFPKGIYLISSTVTLPDNARIIGDGDGSVIKLTTNITAFEAGDYNQFESISFLGNGSNTSQRGINIDSVAGVKVINCNFRTIGVGIRTTRTGLMPGDMFTYGTQISDCYGEACDRGIWMDTRGEYATVTNCTFVSGNYGIYMSGGNNSIIGGNYNHNNYGAAVLGGSNDAHCVMSGVKFNHNNIASIYISGVANGYRIIGCAAYGGGITILNSSLISIEHCDIDVTGFAITSTNNTALKFFGNTFLGSPTWTVTGNTPTVIGLSNYGGLTLTDPVANVTAEIANNAGVFNIAGNSTTGASSGVTKNQLWHTMIGKTGDGADLQRDINVGSFRSDVPPGSTVADPNQIYNPNSDPTKSVFNLLYNDGGVKYALRAMAFTGNVGLGNNSTPAISLITDRTDAWGVAKGTTAERPTGAAAYLRYNSDSTRFEGYNGSAWKGIAWTSDAGGAGEANTASNLGGGLANWDSKSGVDLRFNTFSSTDFDLASNLITVDASIARLASPALTGTPTAPTAAPGTNTTQIATTAFVQNAISAFTSGTFTSTLTNGTNVSSSSVPSSGQYTRIGNVVTYSFTVTVTATGSGATELGISTPIATDFGANGEAAAAATSSVSFVAGMVMADGTNDRLSLQYTAPGAGSLTFYCTITFRVTPP